MSCKLGEDCGCGFVNTGMKYGSVWEKMHKLIDEEVGCQECNVHGHDEIDGIREHIAVGIGKKPHNSEKYEAWVNEVKCVHDQCVRDGRCKPL